MMRSLWSAASGMIAQQTNVDTISHNLANVNTTGYKSQRTEFKSLLYQNLQTRTTTANGENKPIPAQVGLGTRVASTSTFYTQGAMQAMGSFPSVEMMAMYTIRETAVSSGRLARQGRPYAIRTAIRF